MTSTQQIIKFNIERNLTDFNPESEYRMLLEELEEFHDALALNDLGGMIDALNDLRVIATGAVWKAEQDPELSLKQTCKEILSRQGSIGPDGKWLKDRSQDPSTLYTANYALSRRSPH